MTLIGKLLFDLGIGNHKFNSDIWKQKTKKRKLFVKDIIGSKTAIEMNKEQLIDYFGIDKREYINNVWSYVVSIFRGGETKNMLCFYFDRNDIVIGVRIKYRKKMK